MKAKSTIAVFLLIAASFASCKKENESLPENPMPSIDNIEVGLRNNETGIIGKDFHLNANVVAGDKIETVQVKIIPRSGETYSKSWNHEISWDQYKDTRNATVHKHFDIPADAAEGKYDFLIIVNDQNGTKLEVKRSITIYSEANAPFDPSLNTH